MSRHIIEMGSCQGWISSFAISTSYKNSISFLLNQEASLLFRLSKKPSNKVEHSRRFRSSSNFDDPSNKETNIVSAISCTIIFFRSATAGEAPRVFFEAGLRLLAETVMVGRHPQDWRKANFVGIRCDESILSPSI